MSKWTAQSDTTLLPLIYSIQEQKMVILTLPHVTIIWHLFLPIWHSDGQKIYIISHQLPLYGLHEIFFCCSTKHDIKPMIETGSI